MLKKSLDQNGFTAPQTSDGGGECYFQDNIVTDKKSEYTAQGDLSKAFEPSSEDHPGQLSLVFLC